MSESAAFADAIPQCCQRRLVTKVNCQKKDYVHSRIKLPFLDEIYKNYVHIVLEKYVILSLYYITKLCDVTNVYNDK